MKNKSGESQVERDMLGVSLFGSPQGRQRAPMATVSTKDLAPLGLDALPLRGSQKIWMCVCFEGTFLLVGFKGKPKGTNYVGICLGFPNLRTN